MYCYKCNSHVCGCLDLGSNRYQDDLGYLEEVIITKPKLFEPVSLPPVIKPDYQKVDVYDPQRDSWGPPLQPMFKPLNMDVGPWSMMPTPPGFIKFG